MISKSFKYVDLIQILMMQLSFKDIETWSSYYLLYHNLMYVPIYRF